MPCGRLMVFRLAKSAFTSAEPKAAPRTSFSASSSARALFSLDAAIPSPATALAVAPSLMVIASVEPQTPARRAIAPAEAPSPSRSNVIAWRTQRGDVPPLRPLSYYANSGLWMIPLQNAGLLDIREITACRPGGSATQAARRRHGPSAVSPASSISAIVALVTRPTNLPPASVTATVAAEFCCINLSACSKGARQPTVR